MTVVVTVWVLEKKKKVSIIIHPPDGRRTTHVVVGLEPKGVAAARRVSVVKT